MTKMTTELIEIAREIASGMRRAGLNMSGHGLLESGDAVHGTGDVISELCDALAASEAARERAEQERDRLIEAWPDGEDRSRFVTGSDRFCWWRRHDAHRNYETREAAVRAAAGLDAATRTEQPAQGEGE